MVLSFSCLEEELVEEVTRISTLSYTKLSATVHSEPVRRKAEEEHIHQGGTFWKTANLCNFIKLFLKKLKYFEMDIEYL